MTLLGDHHHIHRVKSTKSLPPLAFRARARRRVRVDYEHHFIEYEQEHEKLKRMVAFGDKRQRNSEIPLRQERIEHVDVLHSHANNHKGHQYQDAEPNSETSDRSNRVQCGL